MLSDAADRSAARAAQDAKRAAAVARAKELRAVTVGSEVMDGHTVPVLQPAPGTLIEVARRG